LNKAIRGYAKKIAEKQKHYSKLSETQKQELENSIADTILQTIDFNLLADLTEGYSGADIASICQEVKMQIVREELKGKEVNLDNNFIISIISKRRPSITKADLAEYEQFKLAYGERI
jgi:SpoVK/Ycf46/Vps4 family AAA+-type ATPase